MTLNKSSHNNFFEMFKDSMRKTCVIPFAGLGIMLLYFLLQTYGYFSQLHYFSDYEACVFDEIFECSILINLAIIFGAVLTAILLFSFQWSKKHCNVIYSIGMSRADIFKSKILGGLVPTFASVVVAFILEIVFGNILKEEMNKTAVSNLLLMTLTWFTVYAVSFIVCSVVFSNCGNVVEAVIFTGVLVLFPTVLNLFLENCKGLYTLGGNAMPFGFRWNWDEPFFFRYDGYNGLESLFGVNMQGDVDCLAQKLTLVDWSTCIIDVIYSVILYFIGLASFKKHKVENSGTFGKCRGIVEVTGFAVGFYAFFLMLTVIMYNNVYGNGNIISFISCCVAFLVAELVFKLIFSAKRKKAVLNTFKILPAYCGVLGAVTLVFSLGMFGYSAYVPEKEDVSSISVQSVGFSYDDYFLAGSSFYGLKPMNLVSDSMVCDLYDHSAIIFNKDEEIDEIMKLHKVLITDGKIKDKSKDACSAPIKIIYNMKDGSKVIRQYYETNTETAKKILAINDTSAVKKHLNGAFSEITDNSAVAKLEKYLGVENITIENGNEVFDSQTGDYLGSILTHEDGYTYFCYANNGSLVELEGFDYSHHSNYGTRLGNMLDAECYLYPKDMTKGYNIGNAEEELIEALKKDILKQSAGQHFMQKAEDEIGVISFGLSDSISESMTYDGAYYEVTDDTDIAEPKKVKVGEYAEEVAWNIGSSDIGTVVVTKDMKNTIKYLEDNDMMKYFENSRKISDIKAVKLATPSELYPNTPSENVPIFYAAYWNAYSVKNIDTGYSYYYFDKISNQITDVKTITKLIDSSVLFGYCGNDYRIMEITYNDGSIATTLIPADAYNSIVK